MSFLCNKEITLENVEWRLMFVILGATEWFIMQVYYAMIKKINHERVRDCMLDGLIHNNNCACTQNSNHVTLSYTNRKHNKYTLALTNIHAVYL